jgi:hypothetical protein
VCGAFSALFYLLWLYERNKAMNSISRVSALFFVLISTPLWSGCGSGENSTAGTPDEMTRFLAEHPELADPNPHEAAAGTVSTAD